MSGHSKWNNIKHKKEANDSKKSSIFSQVSKLIRVAVKKGKSADPQFNASLRTALEKARLANMPKDKIKKAVDRGLGKSNSGANLQEIVYEAFGHFGEAYMVVALTDNVNRTSSEIKFVLSRHQGSLGSPGSASYLFKHDQNGDFIATMPLEVDRSAQAQIEVMMDQFRSLEDVEDVYCSAKMSDL